MKRSWSKLFLFFMLLGLAFLSLVFSSCEAFLGANKVQLDFGPVYKQLLSKAGSDQRITAVGLSIKNASNKEVYSEVLDASTAETGVQVDLETGENYTLEVSVTIKDYFDASVSRVWDYKESFTPAATGTTIRIVLSRAVFETTSLHMYTGQNKSLSATVSDSSLELGWSSSNSEVVSLEYEGTQATLYAQSAGTATIQALPDDKGLDAICVVTVSDPPSYEDYIARYDFEDPLSDGSGDVISDTTGNYNGTYYPDYTYLTYDDDWVGSGGYCFELDEYGYDENENEIAPYAYVPASVLQDDDMTISFWLQISMDATSDLQVFLGQLEDSATSITETSGWVFYFGVKNVSSDETCMLVVYGGEDQLQLMNLTQGLWIHFVMVRSADDLTIYVTTAGTETSTDSFSISVPENGLVPSSQGLGIGSGVDATAGLRYYPALNDILIDKLTIYDGPLSSDEISNLYSFDTAQ